MEAPPLVGPSRTFVFDRELLYPVSQYTKTSRLVLYANGAFGLEYPRGRIFPGSYKEVDAVITFRWGHMWEAQGILTGNSLMLQYHSVMQGADFEDAIYVLSIP